MFELHQTTRSRMTNAKYAVRSLSREGQSKCSYLAGHCIVQGCWGPAGGRLCWAPVESVCRVSPVYLLHHEPPAPTASYRKTCRDTVYLTKKREQIKHITKRTCILKHLRTFVRSGTTRPIRLQKARFTFRSLNPKVTKTKLTASSLTYSNTALNLMPQIPNVPKQNKASGSRQLKWRARKALCE